MEPTLFDYTTGIVGIFITWALYSQLLGKPNPFRSWAEASYVGFATGLNLVISMWFVYNNGYLPLTRGDWIMVLGIVLGILMILRLHPKYYYIARVPIAIAVGTQLGLSLRTIIFSGFINQIQSIILPLYVTGDLIKSLYNTTISISTILMLSFFLYTIEQRGVLNWTAKLGEYAMYIAFGALFAQTFMGRLGLLVGYIQQITDPPWKIPYTLGFAVLILAAILIMDRYGIAEKYAD